MCKIQGSTPSVQKQRKFAGEAIDKIVYARVMQIGYCEKLTEQTTLNENDVNL